ncbi:MAG: GGDEF domain-containing protein [Thermoanaerobaculia bacterium]
MRTSSRLRQLVGIWLALVLLSVAFGVLNVWFNWNGIALSIAGIPFEVTIYPPFLFSVLIALWLGPTWAAIPIYLANLASALASGLDFPLAALFAVAGVMETLMLWASLVAVRVDPDLRRGRDLAWFAGAGLVAAVTGSLAAILWNSSHALDPVAGQQIWRGWVIGDLLQLMLIVLPILLLGGRKVRGWVDRHFVSPPLHDFSYTHGVSLTVVGFGILGLVVFLGVHQALGTIELALDARTASGDLLLPRLREIVLVMGLLSTALIVTTGLFSTALARLGERQRRDAMQDSLTGCANRRAFGQNFQKEAERSRRLRVGIGLLFADLDRFKELNDRHGHAVGDVILERAARRIEGALRETDLLFRWGGEEFVVLMPHTPGSEVGAIAERVREALDRAPLLALPGGEEIAITASLGGASAADFPFDATELLRRADDACYEAKRLGRNRVQLAAPGEGR